MSIRAARSLSLRSLVVGLALTPALATGCSDAGASDASATADQDLYGVGSLAQQWPGGVVSLCYADTTNNAALRATIPGILARTWSAAANVTFTGFGACSSSTPQVKISFAASTNGVTDNLGYAARNVTLVSNDTTANNAHFVYEVIHEMGHVLGFAHEQQRPDNWLGGTALQCGDSPSDVNYAQYAPKYGGINLTTTYDANSIMNYCDPLGNNTTTLSAGDVTGVQKAYGAPHTAPVVTSIANASGPNQGGTRITINGVGFDTSGGTTILVGGATATNVQCATPIQCSATTPWYGDQPTVQVVDVQAVVSGRTSAAVPPDRFTYTAGPACTSQISCTGIAFGFPDLIVSCPGVEKFANTGTANKTFVSSGTTYSFGMEDFAGAVSACDPSTGSCTAFSTYEPNASYCGAVNNPPPPPSCNGDPKPTRKCSAVWHCCGSDGWSCGVCQ